MRFARLAQTQSALRDAVTAACRRDERECVRALLALAALPEPAKRSAQALARELATAVRAARATASGVDALLLEFSLDSDEGVALMCLAEALLRIPDRATAERLIRDKIARGDWQAHLGHSASLFVNAAAWGLMVTGKLVTTASDATLSGALTRLIARGGEPLVRRGVELALRLLGRQFVIAETIEEALERAVERERRGYRYCFDMLGEAAMTAADARHYLAAYEHAIHAIGRAAAGRGVRDGPGISVKLSALHPRYSRAQRERVMRELLPRLKGLLLLARRYGIGLSMDAEEAERLELSLDLLEALALDPELAGWEGLGFVAQAYQKRCPFVIDWLVDLARRSGRRFMVRLVKGAYWDSEIKHAQLDGLEGYPVYTRKAHTDLAYLACARKLLDAPDAVYPQFATHNAHTLAAVHHMAQERDCEFQCLHGMGETLYDLVVGEGRIGRACRIYAPVGTHETLLPYLVRRLLENGANSSFVNRIVDASVPIEALIADPLAATARHGGAPHPMVPLPCDLYGAARRNSRGLDLASEHALAALEPRLNTAAPAADGARPVRNPADRDDIVGAVEDADAAEAERAVSGALQAAPAWAAVPAAERAARLERAADLLQARMPVLMALAVREAGKTLPDAVAEVREAVDFCRYYAAQARAMPPDCAPRGPIACISPWNFPLAIFTGQVAAALAAGNPVLAKPAEQTPLIAAEAVRLLHEAGIPRGALQLLHGAGETVGAALVADARIAGVLFTGSTEAARLIARALAPRDDDPLLVAETGGQNALIADSSALPEQLVADALASAFGAAGQRCSALRVLCLQEEIADRVIAMLKGAMDELRVGDPARLSTDVGPVIDQAAQRNLLAYIQRMKARAAWWHQAPLAEGCMRGTFVAPIAFGIESIGELGREVFGPLLHVVRYRAVELDRLIAAINATGYGLTLGIHSRIDETIARIAAGVRAGNIYVNRNIIGAVVGVQPFGGEGLSGTGPKAGGSLYLPRLTRGGPRPQVGEPARSVTLEGLELLRAAAEDEALLVLIGEYAAGSPLRRECMFAGATGERNTLYFAPRGAIACLAVEADALARQAAAALACGNTLVLPDAPAARAVAAALGAHARLSPAPHEEDIALALFEGEAAAERRLRASLAAREGAIVPLVKPAADGRYDLYRLAVERSLSVNTTAAGGNASLMALEP